MWSQTAPERPVVGFEGEISWSMHGSWAPGGGSCVIDGSDKPTSDSAEADSSAFYAKEYDGQVRRAYLLLADLGAAQDAVQDAFVEVLQRWDRIDRPGPYLNRCVLNACRDRAGSRARMTPSSDSISIELAAPADSRMAELWDVMAALPFNQRAALVLRYFDGRTEAEIAELIGTRTGTVGPLLTRGLRKLRSQISSVS